MKQSKIKVLFSLDHYQFSEQDGVGSDEDALSPTV